ncbi:MAG: tetratricopeptide repeat protein, partial [Gemmatimonadales bacterium]|nr:tetratricopeptide repeat protein [Gemmatimonadales bacterium]
YDYFYGLGQLYGATRRYPEAERMFNSAISLSPDILGAYRGKAWLYVHWDGDTRRAWRVLDDAASNNVPAAGLAEHRSWLAFLDRDYAKALDAASTMPDTALYCLHRAYAHYLSNQPPLAQVYADSARVIYEQRVADLESEARGEARPLVLGSLAFPRSWLGEAYALLGREADARREGLRAVALLPVSLDAHQGPSIVWQLARIYVVLGDHDSALEQLEDFVTAPSRVVVPPLRLDPLWDPLRDDPRYRRLLEREN